MKISIIEFIKIHKLEIFQILFWSWNKFQLINLPIEDVIAEVVVPLIIDPKNIIIKMLKNRQIKNNQKKKLELKDSKIQKLIKMEEKAEKLLDQIQREVLISGKH